MSHNRHIHRVQSPRLAGSLLGKVGWRSACGVLLATSLIGCSSHEPQIETVAKAPTAVQVEPADPAPILDHSPIAASAANANSDNKQQQSADHPTEETEMTVLVLDNPELLAQSAHLDAAATLAADAVEEGPRKPHRLRFHYGFDKHQLSDEDEAILRQHAAYLRAHPEVTVRIHGHTDSFGAADYNTFLSRLRANAVAKLLKEEGVREAQVQISAWGSSRPLARPDDHSANRRLELEYHNERLAKAQ
ncbi:OmpA family protein [Marinobacter xestospongiae]|uniref:OmpA family protein n=1 Tax=Marinobacter xestospongiae TaxID=994319 RepID=UPI002004A63C|nr:OmpA family protein [Marinobacter xestospongiae]MCK7568656.1 OmpA family protein [Marinobacter xestospongiae]